MAAYIRERRVRSVCVAGGDTLFSYKTPTELVKHYEGLGYAAERAKDIVSAHVYWQHAEFYKKTIGHF